jgi:hypothetical protein
MPYTIKKNQNGTYRVTIRDTGRVVAFNTKNPRALIAAIEINKKKKRK